MKRILLISVLVLFYTTGKTQLAPWNFALQFDGVDDHVTIPHNTVFNVAKTTIEMWFYWEAPSSTATQFLIGKGFEQLEIHTGYQEAAGEPIIENSLRFIPTTGVYFDTQANVIGVNKWYHVAFVYDPTVTEGYYKCYIDGVETSLTERGANPATTAIITTSDPILLGQRYGNAMRFTGIIDEVRIWNTVRTQPEIQLAMNSELTGNEAGFVAYYKMSDGSGTMLTDDTPDSNNGTLVNGTSWVFSPVVEITWTGATSSDWNTETNWSPALVPRSTDMVTIPAGTANYPEVSPTTNAQVKNLTHNGTDGQNITVANGGKLTVNGSYTAVNGAKIVVDGTIVDKNK
jgi:hypothetical protein